MQHFGRRRDASSSMDRDRRHGSTATSQPLAPFHIPRNLDLVPQTGHVQRRSRRDDALAPAALSADL